MLLFWRGPVVESRGAFVFFWARSVLNCFKCFGIYPTSSSIMKNIFFLLYHRKNYLIPEWLLSIFRASKLENICMNLKCLCSFNRVSNEVVAVLTVQIGLQRRWSCKICFLMDRSDLAMLMSVLNHESCLLQQSRKAVFPNLVIQMSIAVLDTHCISEVTEGVNRQQQLPVNSKCNALCRKKPRPCSHSWINWSSCYITYSSPMLCAVYWLC